MNPLFVPFEYLPEHSSLFREVTQTIFKPHGKSAFEACLEAMPCGCVGDGRNLRKVFLVIYANAVANSGLQHYSYCLTILIYGWPRKSTSSASLKPIEP